MKGGEHSVQLYLPYTPNQLNRMANRIELIKKMFVKGLNSSERIQLSEEEPMKKVLLEQWEEPSDSHITDKVDSEAIWRNIAAICRIGDAKVKKNARLFRLAYATAAAVALLLIGTWVAHLLIDPYQTVIAPANDRIAWTLPDSSTVWLNAGSTLRYKKEFRKDRRVTLLGGEAYFDVVRMTDSPFRVVFQKACVEVKGTEFTVKSQHDRAEITLFTGRIVFSAPLVGNPVEMQPSDHLLYDAVDGKVSLTHVDTSEYDWRVTEYRFVDKPLGDMIEFLNRTYKVTIVVKNNEYKQSLFTGTIRKGEALLDVLNKVCISFGMELSREGNNIILSKL